MSVLADDGGGVSFLAGVVTAPRATRQLADGRSEDQFDPSRVVGHCGATEWRKEESETEGEGQTEQRTGQASGPHGFLITPSPRACDYECVTASVCETQQRRERNGGGEIVLSSPSFSSLSVLFLSLPSVRLPVCIHIFSCLNLCV